jgi:hypothetical protein
MPHVDLQAAFRRAVENSLDVAVAVGFSLMDAYFIAFDIAMKRRATVA